MESYPALYIPSSDRLANLPPETPSRFVVGRSSRANLSLPDVAWSREQFAVQREQGVYYLEQISQKVPTLVNGSRLEARHRLQHGDRIIVSSTELVFLDYADPRLRKPPDAPPPVEEDEGLTRKAVTDAAAESVAAPGELILDRDAVIGRDRASVTLVLDHPRVSRRHAQVSVKGGKVSLRDLGSSNGTYVNGERIDAYRVLQVDDRIDIGPYSFRFTGRSLAQSSREGNLRIVDHNLSRAVRSRSGTPPSRSWTT
jgi:pSer/pThr/pTyr-binding forkhead associated (FHA) protein